MLIYFSESLSAQNFFQQGATWQFEAPYPGSVGYHLLEYAYDTLLQNKSYQVITHQVTQIGMNNQTGQLYILSQGWKNPLHFRTEQDSVWYWDSLSGIEFRYAVLNAQTGSSWDVRYDTNSFQCSKTINTVTGSSLLNVNGHSLKSWKIIQSSQSSLSYTGDLVERIGFLGSGCIWPEVNDCSGSEPTCPTYYFLRCYYDPEIGVYNTRYPEACDHYLVLTGMEADRTETISISPNPSPQQVLLSGLKMGLVPAELSLFNVSGQQVFFGRITDDSFSLDVSTFPRGLYFVHLRGSGRLISQKLWVE